MILPRVAIVGGDSLIGRDLEEVFQEGAPDLEVKLISSDVDSAILTTRGGEPTVLHGLDEAIIDKAKVVVLTGSADAARKTLARTADLEPPPAVIDLTYALEDDPAATVVAPRSELPGAWLENGNIYVIAHPAAAALASVMHRLHQYSDVRKAVVHVFEPASERGKAGIDELQQQTVDLLSFRSVPTAVFGRQLSFNMLAGYGTDAPEPLETAQGRVERHLTTLLSRGAAIPVPSVRLIQAPVFHAHCISIWAEFRKKPTEKALREVLSSEQIHVAEPGEESPTNINLASRSGVEAGPIVLDHNNPKAAWFWVAVDNYRTRSEDVLCLTRLLVSGAAQA